MLFCESKLTYIALVMNRVFIYDYFAFLISDRDTMNSAKVRYLFVYRYLYGSAIYLSLSLKKSILRFQAMSAAASSYLGVVLL